MKILLNEPFFSVWVYVHLPVSDFTAILEPLEAYRISVFGRLSAFSLLKNAETGLSAIPLSLQPPHSSLRSSLAWAGFAVAPIPAASGYKFNMT